MTAAGAEARIFVETDAEVAAAVNDYDFVVDNFDDKPPTTWPDDNNPARKCRRRFRRRGPNRMMFRCCTSKSRSKCRPSLATLAIGLNSQTVR